MPLRRVLPLKWLRSKMAMEFHAVGSGTACEGKRSALSGTITAAHPKVPLKHYSEAVSGTYRLPRAFSSPGTRADLAFNDF